MVGIEGRYTSIRRICGKDSEFTFQVDASMDLALQVSFVFPTNTFLILCRAMWFFVMYLHFVLVSLDKLHVIGCFNVSLILLPIVCLISI